MFRRAAFMASAAAVIGVAASAYADEPKRGGQLSAIINPEPPILMLGLNQQGPTQAVAGKIYQSLLTYDFDLNPMPSLAREWEVADDGLTYTFHLQEGVTWHDGEAFTAADAVFSLDEFLPETHPRWRQLYRNVASIDAPDDHTLVIELEEPFPAFIMAFETASAPMIPKHLYEGTDYRDNEWNQTPIGTGPFKFEEWNRGSSIHLVRNDDYWKDGKPYLDEIYFEVIPDAASRVTALETQRVHMSRGEDIEFFDVPRVAQLDHLEVTTQGWEMFAPHAWLEFNVREEPISDKRFRQAVMHAIDREFILNNIFFGSGNVATGPISSSTLFYDDNVPEYEYDPDRARELLDEMGLEPDGNGVRTELRLLPIPYGEAWDRLGEYVRQQLIEVGIQTDLEAADAGTWAERVANWDYDMTFNYLYQYGDPAIGVSRSYISDNIQRGTLFTNTMGYENEEVDRLFEEAAREIDPERRQELYTEVQQILVEEVPVGWLIELEFPTIYDVRFENLVTTAIGTNETYDDVYIAE